MILIALFLAAQEATVRGTVEVGHRVPAARRLRMDSDPKVAVMHAQAPLDEGLLVDADNRIKWAFVYVKRGLEGTYPVPTTPVLLEFNRGILTPRVFGIRAGQELLIRNRDNVLHNCHSLPFTNKEFNFGMPVAGYQEKKRFDAPEVMIKLKCDVHPYDCSWAGVVAHPFFAVTDEHGRFEIPGLPPGRYVLEVRHEKCDAVEREIEVKAGQIATLDFVVALTGGPPPRNWKPFLIAGGAAAAVLVFLGFLLFRRPRAARA